MQKLAFSTNAFKQNTLEEAIDAIAEIGYAGVELMADLHHAYPPVMDAQRREAIRQRISQRGLGISNINAFTLFAQGDTYHPTWIENDPCRRDLRVSHTLSCVEMAGFFGSRTISLQPGGPLIGTDLSRELAGERFAEGLNLILPAARLRDVILAIEPEPGLFIETAAEYLEFKQRYFAGNERIRMNCDVCHLFCVGEDPADVIRRMSEEVVHVHLEDIGANRVHQHLTPGKGAIDFRDIFDALRDVNYDGWVTVELYPYETTAAGVARAAYEHLAGVLA
jgi:sugar phosphate isomerase/epimerase